MSASRWVVRADGLSKCYRIYTRPHQRLMQTLLRSRRRFYREFWALRDVTFECARGETLGIVGRNGSGKSTLLQLIAGTLFASEGDVQVRGRVAALLELGSGFNSDFTGRENVYLNSAVLGRTRRETDAMFDEIADFAGIGDFIEHPINTYSSGMTMRLAFAVAIHAKPDVLIVDEALSVGDTAFQSKCLARIRHLQQSGVAIIVVSHSPNIVLEFCSRAIYLADGLMRMTGSAREVLERYAEDQVQSERTLVIRAEATARAHGTPDAREASGAVAAAPDFDETSDAVGTEADINETMGVVAAASAVAPAPADATNQCATEIVGVTIHDERGSMRDLFSHGDTVCIDVDVAFHADNDSPCLGIQLRTTDDIVLWATTTLYMNQSMPAVAAGERRRYTWRLAAALGGNRFVFGLGVGGVRNEGYLRDHRLHYAGHFDVMPLPAHGTGWLELGATLAVAPASGPVASRTTVQPVATSTGR